MTHNTNKPATETPQDDRSNQDSALLQLLALSIRPYWRPLVVALVLMVCVAGLNAVPPFLLQRAIDGPIARREVDGLWTIAVLYGVTALLLFAFTFAYTWFLQQAGQRALADLRTRLLDHILHLDYAFLSSTPTGELVSRLGSDIDQLSAVMSSSSVVILVESVTFIVIVTVMVSINWQLALLALAVIPILAFITRYFRRRIRASSTGERSAMARISAFLNEHLHGMTVVQLFGRQEESFHEFDIFNGNYREALIVLRRESALFLAAQEILAAVGLGLLLYGGGQGVLAGWATLGTLIAFVQYADRAFQPVLRLSQEYNTVQIALGAAERIHRMLQTTARVQSPATPARLDKVKGAIEFRDLHFSYGGDGPVLRGIDLSILPGQSVAIVGATGAGKSSLVSLLARYYDPQQGQVLLDGIDLRQLSLSDLRRAVAVVPQDPVCLAGTIRHNIRLYREDVNDDDVRQAAEFSNAARFIEELPGNYDFEVLPGGANLSQGQRQLLSLARALALNPQAVLVLDEATSSIDTSTEAYIQEALERILRSRTSLVIAHRLSTVRRADRILVMERGLIVEDGNHESLLQQNGYYANLHHHQVLPHTAYPV